VKRQPSTNARPAKQDRTKKIETKIDEPPSAGRSPTDLVPDGDELDEPDTSDLDEANEANDDRWEVFLLDDDDCEPLPDFGDFWMPD
jgi:hypothetical protein